MSKIISWEEVISTHRTIAGINCKGGIINSLLCNTSKDQNFPNRIEKDIIYYFINLKKHFAGEKAFINSIQKQNAFPVFEKLGVNKWRDCGRFCVKSRKNKSKSLIEYKLIRN